MSRLDTLRTDPIGSLRGWWNEATLADRVVYAGIAVFATLLLVGMAIGAVGVSYVAGLLVLVAMYSLLTTGLNIQWGYAGLINFSVIAFWGIGAYTAMLVSSANSPLELGWHPATAIPLAIVAGTVVAVFIGIPTLRLREDYLAIASLGLAEVVRLVLLNERQWTAGSQGISGIPIPLSWLPVGNRTVVLILAALFLATVFLFVRRIHRSPWGRVLRTIRADEDLAEALGKDTYWLKMQAFVIGSVVMALSGVLYVFYAQYLGPGDLLPLETFYVWVALILGGTGSDKGALLGGLVLVTIREGTRFISGTTAFELLTRGLEFLGVLSHMNTSSLRLFLVGVLIVLVIRYRPQGLLPPREELIWPDAKRQVGDGREGRKAHADGPGAVGMSSGGEEE